MNSHTIRKYFLSAICAISALLTGCVTTSGNYVVTATDTQGNPIKAKFHVQGRHIYSARNAICSTHPGATVSIHSAESGKDLQGESPYKCR